MLTYGSKDGVFILPPDIEGNSSSTEAVMHMLGEDPNFDDFSRVREYCSSVILPFRHYLEDLGAQETLSTLQNNLFIRHGSRFEVKRTHGVSPIDVSSVAQGSRSDAMCLSDTMFDPPAGMEQIPVGWATRLLIIPSGQEGTERNFYLMEAHLIYDFSPDAEELSDWQKLNFVAVGGNPPVKLDEINLFQLLENAGIYDPPDGEPVNDKIFEDHEMRTLKNAITEMILQLAVDTNLSKLSVSIDDDITPPLHPDFW